MPSIGESLGRWATKFGEEGLDTDWERKNGVWVNRNTGEPVPANSDHETREEFLKRYRLIQKLKMTADEDEDPLNRENRDPFGDALEKLKKLRELKEWFKTIGGS